MSTTTATRPLILSHGSLEHVLPVPTSCFFAASELLDQFNKSLPEPTENFASDQEPSSPIELLAKFLGFVADFVQEGETKFAAVLENSLNEFEIAYCKAMQFMQWLLNYLMKRIRTLL